MRMSIKEWFLGEKKENYRQILERMGRITHLEKKVMRQEKLFREMQTIVFNLILRIVELEKEKKGVEKNA